MRRLAPVLVLILASCGSVPTQTYTLTSVPPSQPASQGRALQPPIELGDVSIPATIDRSSIVQIASGGRLDVHGEAVWGAPLQQLIRRTLSADLAHRLPPGSVLAPGDPAPPGGLRILLVNIEQFASDTSGRVTLTADWTLSRGGQASGTPRHEVITVEAGSGAVSAVVPAMSSALGELADRIAAGLV
jgi:uncharacterized protein